MCGFVGAAGVAASVQRLFFGVSAIDDAVTLGEAGVEEVGKTACFLRLFRFISRISFRSDLCVACIIYVLATSGAVAVPQLMKILS